MLHLVDRNSTAFSGILFSKIVDKHISSAPYYTRLISPNIRRHFWKHFLIFYGMFVFKDRLGSKMVLRNRSTLSLKLYRSNTFINFPTKISDVSPGMSTKSIKIVLTTHFFSTKYRNNFGRSLVLLCLEQSIKIVIKRASRISWL